MEFILPLCSTGVAGLFTYIYLDYLSILDTEKPEIKRMFSLLFSIISILLFLLVFKVKELIHINNILENAILLIIFLVIYIICNIWVYPQLIKLFRKSMNKSRVKNDLNPINHLHAIDTVLQSSNQFYIEKYNGDSKEPIMQGFLKKHQLTNDLDSIFIIEPTNVIKNIESIKNIHLYQPKNTDCYFKLFDLENLKEEE